MARLGRRFHVKSLLLRRQVNADVFKTIIAAESSLVGWWRFDEVTGNLLDKKGTNNGTLNGGITRQQPSSVSRDSADKSYEFDGLSGTRIDIGNPGMGNGSADFSIEVVFRSYGQAAGQTPDYCTLVNISSATQDSRLLFQAHNFGPNPGPEFLIQIGTSSLSPGGIYFLQNKDYIVAVTYVASTKLLSLYVNGQFINSLTTAAAASLSTTAGRFGINDDNVNYPLYGRLDEVMFYNAALTAAKIADHANAWLNGEAPIINMTPITIAATVTMTPAMVRTPLINRALTGTMTPVLAVVKTFFRAVTATATLTPAMTASKTYPRTIPATATLTAVMTAAKTYPRTIAATMTATPVMAKIVKYLRAVAATSTVTPVLSKIALSLRTVAATTTLTAVLQKKFLFTRSVSSTETVTMTAAKTYPRTISATTTLTAAMVNRQVQLRTLAAGLTASVAFTKVWGRSVAIAATSALTAALTRRLTAYRAFPYTATFGTGMSPKSMLARTLAVTALISPTLARTVKISKTLAAAATLTANMNVARLAASRTIAATATFTAVQTKSIVRVKAVSATATFAVVMARKISATKPVTMTVTPVVTRALSLRRSIDASAIFTADLTQSFYYQRALAVNASFNAAMTSATNLGEIFLNVSMNLTAGMGFAAYFKSLLGPVRSLLRVGRPSAVLVSAEEPEPEITQVVEETPTLDGVK